MSQYKYPSRRPLEIPTQRMGEIFAVLSILPYSSCAAEMHTVYPLLLQRSVRPCHHPKLKAQRRSLFPIVQGGNDRNGTDEERCFSFAEAHMKLEG